MSNKSISFNFWILLILLCIPFSFYADEFDPSRCAAPGVCVPDDDWGSLSDEEQRQKYSENAEYLRGWAEAGVAEAQLNVGFVYSEGLGVERDNVQAVYWYRKAAQQDNAQAVHWYRKSAEKGFSEAQNNLAIMYFRGWGVEKNLKEALEWFTLASLNGNEQAKTNFEQFDIKNSLPEHLTSLRASLGRLSALLWPRPGHRL